MVNGTAPRIMRTLAVLLLSLSICQSLLAYSPTDFGQQRSLFLRVESDLKQGRTKSFYQHRSSLKEYPLFPFLQYQYLLSNLAKRTPHEIQLFHAKFADSYISDKLLSQWLLAQAKHGNWQAYLQGYHNYVGNNTALECNFIYAHYKTHHDLTIFKHVPNIWLHGHSQPQACDKVFSLWKEKKMLSSNLIWQRIRLAIQKNNSSLAKYLAKELPARDLKLVKLWIRVHKDPYLITKHQHFRRKHPATAEIIVHGLSKIARSKPNVAIHLWKQAAQQHKFSRRQWGVLVRAVALAMANNGDHMANRWLDKIPKQHIDHAVMNAKIKSAIANNNWPAIINLQPNAQQDNHKNDKLTYWHARSLEYLDRRQNSQQLLQTLAQKRSYYGFLSSLRLLKPYSFKNKTTPLTAQHLQQVYNKPSVLRAYELHKLQRTNSSNLEWRKGLQYMTDIERQAAAHLAAKWNIPNWSIVALADANNRDDLKLRFPKSYTKYIFHEAKLNKIEPALVFALIRQESAFIPTARSSAGALGLTQVLPGTARMVAKSINLKLKSKYDLLKPDKNIKIGSKYLKLMLDRYDNNAVLATAAYNAGPTRVSQWLPDFDMPADSWIETIPFRQTRNYVQNVLTYTLIYQELLGKHPALSTHMPIIRAHTKKQ